MRVIFMVLLAMFIIACLVQANRLSGSVPKSLIASLIFMLAGGVSLMLSVVVNLPISFEMASFSLIIIGDLLWMCKSRRLKEGM